MYIPMILSLIFIIICTFCTLIYVLIQKHNEKNIKIGPKINQEFPKIEVEENEGNKQLLYNQIIINKKIRFIIFLDTNCVHCKKALESLCLFNSNSLEKVSLILLNTLENKEKMHEYSQLKNIYFINEDTLYKTLNITMFPLFIEINNKGYIENKGYISNGTLIEYLL